MKNNKFNGISEKTIKMLFGETVVSDHEICDEILKEIFTEPSEEAIKRNKECYELYRKVRYG